MTLAEEVMAILVDSGVEACTYVPSEDPYALDDEITIDGYDNISIQVSTIFDELAVTHQLNEDEFMLYPPSKDPKEIAEKILSIMNEVDAT